MPVAKPRFWETPVRPNAPVDLAAMSVYRAAAFPADPGAEPWLDAPDAEARIAARLAAGEITAAEAELCRKWAADGYLILPGFYPSERLDQVWAEYEAAIAAGHVTPPDEPFYEGDPLPGRVANVHFHVPAMDDMLFDPGMSRLVSLLLGARARPFQTIVGHKSSRQLAHSDSVHMTTHPRGYLAADWIAFEDIHPDSGPLTYYPGSHRLPYLLSDELGIPAEPGYDGYTRLYEPAIQRLIAERGLEMKTFLPKKGDVLIWHANLLHGGSPTNDPRLSRKALVCHYFAEGAICYHDLPGTLAHVQYGQDLYTRRRPSNPAPAPANPVKRLLQKLLG
jgi:ectoine hydroxylase-related dioxygenase (phytanoyl-CoA dioxygenase family)